MSNRYTRTSLRLLSLAVLLWLMAASTGCSPVMQKTYLYTSPPTTKGKACVQRCRGLRERCERTRVLERRQCVQQAQQRAFQCQSRWWWYDSYPFGYGGWGGWGGWPGYGGLDGRFWGPAWGGAYCPVFRCPPANLSECEQRFNQCFTDCGGLVDSEVRCVKHCPNEER